MEITGRIPYKNFEMAQHPNAVLVFRKFLNKIKPKRIIEIGTSQGGLIVALKDIVNELNLDTTIRSYDIVDHKKIYDNIRSMRIDLRVENIFDSEYNELDQSKKEEFVSFVQSEGVTLILCDGGNKINEFKCLSKYLKTGDFIMAHDYSESWLYFKQHIKYKLWNWCEIREDKIKNTCETYNLKNYMKDEFQSVVWTCRQKY